MNVLFVGMADITASYLADRLYREGHHISWVTSEKRAFLWSKDFKGKVYRIGYEVDQLRRILELHGVDTVIFCSGSYEETEFEDADSGNRLLALQNILRAASYTRLKHFVYLSSVELDYKQVYTPILAELQYGESLCRSYQERAGLPVLILRLGFVYGDYPLDKMGYIGNVLSKGVEGETVECRFSEESYVDAVFAEDAAVAANNLIELDKVGTYYVITGHPMKVEELHHSLGCIVGKSVSAAYLREAATLEKDEYWTYSEKLKQDTGWVPFYLLPEKGMGVLAATLDRHMQEKHEKQEKKQDYHIIKEFFSRYPTAKGILEAFVMFLIMTWILPYTQGVTDLRYVDVRLLYIALVAVMFGMKIGLFATILASISYALGLRNEGIDLTFLIYSVETWIPFIIYGIAGSLLGYMSDRKNDSIEEEEEKFKNLMGRYSFLKGIHKEALEVKGRLQQQISASKESFGKVYEVAEQLNTLSPDKVFYHAVDVMSDTIVSCEAAIWLVNPGNSRFARRKACSVGIREELPNSLKLDDYPLLTEGFEKENLFVNRELDERYPDFAAPVYHEGKTIAFVAVYRVEAEKFTLYYQNLFKVLVGLIENNLVRALEYEEKRKAEKYLPDTELLNPRELEAVLRLMEDEKEKSHHTYLKLKVDNSQKYKPSELWAKLRALIRDNDFAGVDEAGTVLVVLDNAQLSDFPVIQKRFAGREVEVSLC